MNIYEEFINNFKDDVNTMSKLSELDHDQRTRYITDITSRYSKILGFYHSQILSSCRENIDNSMKNLMQKRERKLYNIMERDLKEQVPYMDEFLNDFNFYHGIITGNLLAEVQKGNFDFKIKEE